MKVTLEKSYPLPGPADAAWAVLSDLERVAGCMPGARISEKIDERHYKGTVAVKFGPANLSFRGELEVLELDAATRTLRLVGKGTDASGGSGASLSIHSHVETVDATSSRLVGTSEVAMSGKVAAFGSRLAVPVADQVLGQFAANFARQVQAQAQAQAATGSATSGAPAPAVADGAAAAVDGAPNADIASAAAIDAPASAAAAARATSPAPAAAPLNGFALLVSLLKSWWRGLFGGKA